MLLGRRGNNLGSRGKTSWLAKNLNAPVLRAGASDMRILRAQNRAYVVSILKVVLLFASVWHVCMFLEKPRVTKNMLYSPPVTNGDSYHISSSLDNSRFISERELEMPPDGQQSFPLHVSDCYCEIDGWYGRLGNRISLTAKMISKAESLSCGVRIPTDMLSGFVPGEHSWVRVTNTLIHNDSMTKNSTCGSLTGQTWFRSRPKFYQISSTSHLQLLRKYFAINQTHVLGKTCPSTEHVAMHVRSGDIARGNWSEEGTYEPGHITNSDYGLFPTAYYISVMIEVRARRGSEVPFIIFCETMGNPTCEYFKKLSFTEQYVVLRVGQPLVDDVRLMLCSSEVAVSRGTFSRVFTLSPKPLIKHKYFNKPKDSQCLSVFHWMSSSQQAAKYTNVTKTWKNTGFQRHEVNAAYELNHSEIVC